VGLGLMALDGSVETIARSRRKLTAGAAMEPSMGLTKILMAPILTLAILIMPPPSNQATAEDRGLVGSLAGQLIVAAPGIGDPRFEGSVILVIHQGADGAAGIVINRPITKRPWADLLSATGQDPKGVTGMARIFAGGPMQPDVGLVLHSAEYHDAHTMAISALVSVTSDGALLRAIATGTGPKQSLIAFGYAGWGPGQLEDEMAHNDWYAAPADAALLFDADRDTVWQRAYDRRTLQL
jgi:putative transcriptional regulator